MTHKFGLALLAALALAGAGMFGSVSPSLAQTAQDFSRTPSDISAQQNKQNKGKAGQRQAGPRQAGPRQAGPRQAGPRQAGPRQAGPRQAGPRQAGPRNIGQRNIGQRNIGQAGRGMRGMSIRGASRATIGGRNYSVWRGRHRVRYGNRWRTFVGLGTLGAIAFGAAYYYPYAYIDAPAPFCEGLTEDGCHLRWQEVPTLEGPPAFQCVAYCPWQ